MNATSGGAGQANPFAALLNPQGNVTQSTQDGQGTPAASGAPNTAPLPNPWAPPSAAAAPDAATGKGQFC